MSSPGVVRSVLFLALASGSAQAGNVTIAERPQVGPFATIQAGVDAALEGESLLVTPGTYASFTIDAKSVQVFVTGTGWNDFASITGKVVVRNLAPTQFVVMSRLQLTGVQTNNLYESTVDIASVMGHVRIEDSYIFGAPAEWPASGPSPTTGAGVRVISSLNISFSNCGIWGGGSLPIGNGGDPPTDGGPGLESLNSSIALYACTVYGGSGSDESIPRGGNGGMGYHGSSYGLFASGCTFRGGGGGHGDYGCIPGGVGGHALVIDAAQAHLLDDSFYGGGGGGSFCGPPSASGQTIVALNGSIIDSMPGTERRISATRITPDDANASITVTGQPGDTVYLMLARRPAFVWTPASKGVRMLPKPLLTSALPAGTVGAGGTLVIQRSFDIPDGTVAARLFWLQALCVDSSGVPTLTGPAQVLSLE